MHEATQITYGYGVVNIIMDSESATEIAAPDIRFGDYKDTLKSCFTQKELDEIKDGGTAELAFSFVMEDELANQAQAAAFEDAIKREEKKTGRLEKGVYFEVSATKTVGDGEAEELGMFYENIELQFDVPLYLVGEDRFYYIMTDDMGVCNLEPDIDEVADTLTVSTDDLGTSLILYQDRGPSTEGDGLKLNGDYIIIAGIVTLIIAWFSVDRMHKRDAGRK